MDSQPAAMSWASVRHRATVGEVVKITDLDELSRSLEAAEGVVRPGPAHWRFVTESRIGRLPCVLRLLLIHAPGR
jgi:hypothetical protein